MIGPNGKDLPVALGASASGDRGGDRSEMITSDTGNRPATSSIPEPKDAVEELASAATATPAPAPAAVEVQGNPDTDVSDDEIDALHARFDAMEALLKRKLAFVTLHARFDQLTTWLNQRFPDTK